MSRTLDDMAVQTALEHLVDLLCSAVSVIHAPPDSKRHSGDHPISLARKWSFAP